MNQLQGKISAISSSEHMSLVTISVGKDNFSAVLLETAQTQPLLKIGNVVTLLFKETEVALAKNLKGQLSMRNRVLSKIASIRFSNILTEVILDYGSRQIGSLVTTQSAREMDLRVGEEVTWLVKANEISLSWKELK